MIKCSLIDITTDNRAVICINEDTPDSEVTTTEPMEWISYTESTFVVDGKSYDFGSPHH